MAYEKERQVTVTYFYTHVSDVISQFLGRGKWEGEGGIDALINAFGIEFGIPILH